MKVILTGATGFIGSALYEELHDNSVVAIGRSKPQRIPSSSFIKHDLTSMSPLDLSEYKGGCLIHCAARAHVMSDEAHEPLAEFRKINTSGTMHLANEAVAAGIKRFIYISSIKVNGESTKPGLPFKSVDARNPEDYYGQSKSEAEVQLLHLAERTALEVVIIRPTLVYGPGVKANFESLMNLVSKGLPLPFGCITNNKRSLVSVDNLVDLIITCVDHPKAVNQVFLVSDDSDVSTSEIISQMAISLNKCQCLLPIPKWCYALAGELFGKQDVIHRLLGSLQVDITHTKETLNWVPPQTLEKGFKDTADEFLKSRK